jgi:para-nitrobenzyl esterase
MMRWTGNVPGWLAVAGVACLLTACSPTPADTPGDTAAARVLSPDTPVRVTGGEVQGAVSATDPGIVAFEGIPFAAAPVGDLRWSPPEAVVAWEGVRDATAAGSICVQAGGQDVAQSEDCLFLNVWAPREAAEPLPVLFWIHGGGFTGGSGSTSLYDGTPLAADGAVVVTINYRLNVFGFLAHPALSAESPHDASGNYGLMDMVAGLEWVRDNIASFGGDPGRVTIFGESAGAGAVMSVMLVPQAGGLFHRAISESDWIYGWDRPLRGHGGDLAPAETQGLSVATALEADPPDGADALATMRAASADAVMAAANAGAGSPFLASRVCLGAQCRRLGDSGRPAGHVCQRPAA